GAENRARDLRARVAAGEYTGPPPGHVAVALAIRDRAVLELLYATGVRVAELVGLDTDDLDRRERLIRVLGKGGKERMVPFGVPADRAMAEWLVQRDALLSPTATETVDPRRRAGGDTPAPGALFLGARGGRLGVRQVRDVVH